MPRYFFDIHDGGPTRDDTGMEFDSLDEVRRQAIETLPGIMADEISKDGDRRFFTVLVSDEAGRGVYAATLAFAGLWLSR